MSPTPSRLGGIAPAAAATRGRGCERGAVGGAARGCGEPRPRRLYLGGSPAPSPPAARSAGPARSGRNRHPRIHLRDLSPGFQVPAS